MNGRSFHGASARFGFGSVAPGSIAGLQAETTAKRSDIAEPERAITFHPIGAGSAYHYGLRRLAPTPNGSDLPPQLRDLFPDRWRRFDL
jgi:hypothetical protein